MTGEIERGIEALVRRIVAEQLAAERQRQQVALVTVIEWARARGIARSTAWAFVRTGRLPSIKIGRARRVAVDAEVAPATDAATAGVRARLGIVRGGR